MITTTTRPAEPAVAAESQAAGAKSPAVTSSEDEDVAEIVVVEERVVPEDENGKTMGELSRQAPED